MTGNGNIKISKDFLAENILELLKYTTALYPIVQDEVSQTDLANLTDNVSVDTGEMKQFISDVEDRLLKTNSAIENNARAMDHLLASIIKTRVQAQFDFKCKICVIMWFV